MDSLPKLAEEPILAKQQAEENLLTFLNQNNSENSTDFLQLLQFNPKLKTLGNLITTFLDTTINETFTISNQKLINRSIFGLISEFIDLQKNPENSITKSNVEIETIKDKLNDSLIQIQTYQSNLQKKDEIIDQLNNDNNELEKNIAFLKSKILKKKEKIDDLKLKNRQINLNLEEKKVSIISESVTSKISSLNSDDNYAKLCDEICSLTNTIKFDDFEYKKLLQSKNYCLDICKRLLDLCEEYESRLSMIEEDKNVLKRKLSYLTDENFSLKKSINESILNESNFISEIDRLKSKISNEPEIKSSDNKNIQDPKLRNEIKNLNDTIKTQKDFIITLSNYINRIIVDGDKFIPLLHQSNQIINDSSLRKLIIDSVESIKTELFINDYISEGNQKNARSNQENVRSNQESIRSNQDIVRSNQDNIRSNQDIVRSNQDIVRSNQDNIRSNQEIVRSNQDNIRSNQDIVRSNQENIRSNQENIRSNQIEIQSDQNDPINLRNKFCSQIFGSSELLEKSVDQYIKEYNGDFKEFSMVVALCAANINLGLKIKSIKSRLSKIHSELPIEYQKEDKILSFQNFLADSKELLDSFDRINTNSSFLNFKSDDIKTTVLDFLMEIWKFVSSLQEVVYPIMRYNRNSLLDLPPMIFNSITNYQTQIKNLKIELNEYREKYQLEYSLHNTQQRYTDEANNKIKEKDKQINQYVNCIKNKEKEFQDLKSNLESLIKEKDLIIKNYETEIAKIQKENETNILLLNNTKKLQKSQIDNVIKIEREKKEKEIKEIKEINSENEQNYISKLESKKKKVKTLQNQIKEIIKLYEKKLRKKSEAAENLLNETNEQITLVEISFKQKEEQYQNEIEMLKSKLLEEVQQNSTVKFIEVPVSASSIDIKSNANENDDIFIKQLVKILSDFPNNKLNLKLPESYSTEIAQSRILKALKQLSVEFKDGSESLKNNENLDSSSSTTFINFPLNSSLSSLKSPTVTAKRAACARDLRIWENWAVEIAVTMNIPTDSFIEIRTAIRDAILSQKSKKFMLRNVQSLRIQKKLLIENDLFNLKFSMRKNLSLKSIIFFFISASCISKNCKSKLSRSQII